ncbi:tetratricopeptide repeat protein [Pontibacter sp. G13]|uniref:tetratricopeptide repeat protein n=1 Tax=Pontibacter sp. G13 TaxID=3074898 RepID=UPI00288BC5AB|nr:tetratricopeptide repeat protein [Pontibacter sp. G13]WNJ16088.1 tetratricopeptide repeat protein [Pontibacter sp. G13]
MSRPTQLPYIFLACTENPATGTQSPAAITHVQSISALLADLVKQKGCRILESREGTRVFPEDILFQKHTRDRIQIAHFVSEGMDDSQEVSFRSVSGQHINISLPEFAELLGAFSKLKVVMLTGMSHPGLAQLLIQAGIPQVIEFTEYQRKRGDDLAFYQSLIQGTSTRQAFQALANQFPHDYPLLAYRIEDGTGEILPPETPAVSGLHLHPNSEEAQKWRLVDNSTGEASATPAPEPKSQRPQKPKATSDRNRQKRLQSRGRKGKKSKKRKDQSSKYRIPLIAGGSIAAILIAGLAIWNFAPELLPFLPSNNSAANNARSCPFPEADSNFHVLVLNFTEGDNCQQSLDRLTQSTIQKLEEWSEDPYIHLDVKHHGASSCREIAAIQQTMDGCHADLVIWGRVIENELSESQIEISYIAKPESDLPNITQVSVLQSSLPMEDFYEDRDLLTNKVGEYVLWDMAHWATRSGNYESAIHYLMMIKPSSLAFQAEIDEAVADNFLMANRHEEALAYFDTRIEAESNWPDLYTARANARVNLGDTTLAKADFSQALELDPQNAKALMGRSEILIRAGHFSAARKDLDQAIQLNPDFAPLYVKLGKVHEALGNELDALRAYRKATNLNAALAEGYLGFGRITYKRDPKEGVPAEVHEALKLKPNFPQAWILLFQIHKSQKRWDLAYNSLSQAVRYQQDPELYLLKSEIAIELGEITTAIQDLDQVLKLAPEHREARENRADMNLAIGEHEQALADYEKLSEQFPKDYDYRIQIGACQKLMGQLSNAEQAFIAAIRIDPDRPEAYFNQGLLLMNQGEYSKALAEVSKAISKDGNMAEAWMSRGRILLAQKKYSGALKDFNKALTFDSKLADAFAYRGSAYLGNGNSSAALKDFQRASELGTTLPEANLGLGEIYFEQRSFDRALQAFDLAVKGAPFDPAPLKRRANYFEHFRQFDKALLDLNRVVELVGETDTTILLKRSHILARLNQYEDALRDIDKVLEMSPNSVSALCQRGNIHQTRNQYLKAAEDFETALEINPQSSLALYHRAALSASTDRYEDALIDLQRVINMDPDFSDAYNLRGNVYFQTEDFDLSLADLDRAIELNPRNAMAYNSRGDLARKAGDYQMAIENYTLAIEYDPFLEDAHYHRGFILALQGKHDEALPDVRRSLEIDPENGLRQGFLTKIYARQGQTDLFFQHLEMALKHGYPTLELEHDPAFRPYRQHPKFQLLMKTYDK